MKDVCEICGQILDPRNCVMVTILGGADNLTDEDIVSYAMHHGTKIQL